MKPVLHQLYVSNIYLEFHTSDFNKFHSLPSDNSVSSHCLHSAANAANRRKRQRALPLPRPVRITFSAPGPPLTCTSVSCLCVPDRTRPDQIDAAILDSVQQKNSAPAFRETVSRPSEFRRAVSPRPYLQHHNHPKQLHHLCLSYGSAH